MRYFQSVIQNKNTVRVLLFTIAILVVSGLQALSSGATVQAYRTQPAYIVGYTWYTDGAMAKSGPSGTAVYAYATQVVPNSPYMLMSGLNNCTTDLVAINPVARTSSSSGYISITSGNINRPAGTYDVCFYNLNYGAIISVVSNPLKFTVTD